MWAIPWHRSPTLRRIPLLSAALLLLTASVMRSDEPDLALTQYVDRSWSRDEGLPSESVWSLLQTRDGFLWVGTDRGLLRFDGVEWLDHTPRNEPGLVSDVILSLSEDPEGRLWIGTIRGLSVREAGIFRALVLPKGYENAWVMAVQPAADRVWIGTSKGLVWWSADQVESIPEFAGYSITELAAVPGGLWVGSNRGLGFLGTDGRRRPPPLAAPEIQGHVTSLLPTKESVWVGTGDGLFLVGADGGARREGRRSGLPDSKVNTLLQDDAGHLWAGTNEGVARRRGDRWEVLPSEPRWKAVRFLLQGREGGIWIATMGGLRHLRPGRLVPFGEPEGWPGGSVCCVLTDGSGDLWIGTDEEGLYRSRAGSIPTPVEGLEGTAISALAAGPDGGLWIGTARHGIHRWRQGRVEPVLPREGKLPEDVVALLIEDEDDIWIGTGRHGAFRLRDGRLQAFAMPSGVHQNAVLGLFRDPEGEVWISTVGGLARRSGDRFVRASDLGLPGTFVFDIYWEPEGPLWAATLDGGLVRVGGDEITVYDRHNGLGTSQILSILDPGDGSLWLSSEEGIVEVRKSDLDAVARGRKTRVSATLLREPLRGAELHAVGQPAAARTANGRLWFTTTRGLVEAHPEWSGRNDPPPLLHLEAVRADGRRLSSPPASITTIPPGTRRLEIEYVGLGFPAPRGIRYRHWLEGFDPGWIEAGTRRTVSYTNLEPGFYTFRVQATNRDGVPSPALELPLRAEPLFHQRASVRIFVLLAAVLGGTGLGALVHRLRVRSLQGRRRELERLVAERTHQLEKAKDQLERLALQDPLTGLANRRRFQEALDEEWGRATRSGAPLSLLIVDIDRFKSFNDRYGHLKGDEALRRVADLLAGACRRLADMATRLGGEEFAILLPDTEIEGAEVVAEGLRTDVEEAVIPHEDADRGRLTISVGVATRRPAPGGDANDLLAAADQALYRAKREGRNRIAVDRG